MADAKNPSLPKSAGSELGQSGTLIQNGIIYNEEYNRNLVGMAGNHKYEIMRRSDSTVRSTLQVCKLPVLSTTWGIKPAALPDGTITKEAQEKADFINRELFDRNINWHSFMKQALTMLDFGHSVFEKVFEVTEFEGKMRIGLKKLASRKQISIYAWETRDQKPGITQLSDGKFFDIPREKLIVFTFDQEGDNYEGTSLLRYVYKDWDIKDKLTLVNAMALEKLGVGVPVVSVKTGQTANPTDEQNAIDALMNMRANNRSYMKIPESMMVEMLDLKGNTTKDIIPTLSYHDSRIMKSILAGFLELGGASGSGSQALSKDLSSLFMKSEESIAKDLVWTITQDLIKQICDLNYADMSEGYPRLDYGQIADDDTVALATAIQGLMTSGAITRTIETEDHLRSIYRLPELTEEDKEHYEERHQTPPSGLSLFNPGGGVGDVNIPEKDKKELDKENKKDVQAMIREARERREILLAALQEA